MLINGQNVQPMPGHVFLKMESLYKDVGFIHIPVKYKTAPHIIGRIADVNMRQEDERTLGFKLGPEDRVIMNPLGGRHIADDIWDYSIIVNRPRMDGRKHPELSILALVGDDIDLAPAMQEIARCMFCGDAKSGVGQNMILDNGICPRCHRNQQGEVINPAKVTSVSEEEF